MNRVFIQQGSAAEVFAAIRAEWQELFDAAECSPFLSWEWMSVWFESFGENKTPFILKAYRDDELIGILPLFAETIKIAGVRFNRLSLMGKGPGGADHLDLIAKPGDRSDSLTAIFDFLQKGRYSDMIRLENLAGGSETINLLKELSQAKSSQFPRIGVSINAVCPQIDLTPGFAAVLSSSKRSDNFKRRLRKLERIGDFEYRSVTGPNETAAAFERFLRLHNKRRETDGGSELTGHPRLIAFQRRLVTKLSRAGLIRFDELWTEGECRSSIYGLDDGRTFYFYNSGFDPEFSHLSAGLVLLGLSIKSAVERGRSTYDFLRGDEPYKFDWANRDAKLVTVSLGRSTFPVIAYERIGKTSAGLRSFSKSILPAGIAEPIGAWRRTWKRNYQLSDR